MADVAHIERGLHAFEPRHDGRACRQLIDVVDHRPIECGAEKSASIHTGMRPSPPELEHRAPLCSMCGREVSHDGDSFVCDPCGAYWNGYGAGEWNDPDVEVCASARKPFDRPDLELQYENIRHHLDHCILPRGHDGRHRASEFEQWTDDQALAVSA